jgi:hypothetical protein
MAAVQTSPNVQFASAPATASIARAVTCRWKHHSSRKNLQITAITEILNLLQVFIW